MALPTSIQIMRRLSFQEWGGTETVVWNTTKELIHKGCQTQIVATSALNSPGKEQHDEVEIQRFPYFYPHFPLSSQAKGILDRMGGDPFSPQMMKYLCEQKVDILHCHSIQRLANVTRRAASQLNIPYVVSCHGRYYNMPQAEQAARTQPLQGSINYGKIADSFLHKERFLKDAAGIVCVGYNEYLSAKEAFPEKEIVYLPNGVDVRKFRFKPANNFRDEHDIPANKKLILCVSRIDYQKNQMMLLEMLKRLIQRDDEVHMVLIGPVSSSAYFRLMTQYIEQNHLEEHVTIIQGLSADSPDLISAYRSADCFILPSIHEPFGIVILEAWASGCPTIASNVGGLQKLIDDNRTGLLFDPEDLYSLIDQYDRLIKSKTLGPRLAQAALAEVEKNYTWENITDHLLNFYDQVITRYQSKKIH